MANLNRVCKVCGTQYRYCPTCAGDSNKPKWMTMFDCQDCKTIFDVATSFNLGKIDKNEAKKKLVGVNINKYFTEAIQNDIDKIMVEPKVEVIEQAIVEEPIIEEDNQKKNKKSKKVQFENQEI